MNAYTDVAAPDLSFSASPGSLTSLGQMVVENTTDAIFVMDTEGRTTFANPAAEEMFGWTSAELKGRKLHDVLHYKHRDGSAFPMSDCPLGQVLATGRGLKLYEDLFFRRDGSGIPVSCSNAILKADGAPTGAILIVRDVSERVVVEQQRDLLLHELEHRLKNTIALVQAMAHQSFSDAPAGEKAAFDRRLVALSKAHDLLTAAEWKETELRDLIEAALRPFGERESSSLFLGRRWCYPHKLWSRWPLPSMSLAPTPRSTELCPLRAALWKSLGTCVPTPSSLPLPGARREVRQSLNRPPPVLA